MGVPKEEERRFLAEFRDRLGRTEQTKYEHRKTQEEIAAVEEIIGAFPEFIREYDGIPISLRHEQVHFVDTRQLPSETLQALEKGEEYGRFYPDNQAVLVFAGPGKLENALTTVHELLHLHSFGSYTFKQERLTRRRAGLAVFSGDEKYVCLEDLDEAVVEELTRRFDERYFGEMPSLRDEVNDREAMRRAHPEKEIAWAKSGGQSKEGLHGYAYRRKRERLWTVIRQIREHHPERYARDEEVFRLFAKALLSGRILELARTLEDAYGRGALKRLADETWREL